MTQEQAIEQCSSLNAQLSEADKKYKKWVVSKDKDGNYSVVLEYKGIKVSANRKGKGILLITLIYILWKNLLNA